MRDSAGFKPDFAALKATLTSNGEGDRSVSQHLMGHSI